MATDRIEAELEEVNNPCTPASDSFDFPPYQKLKNCVPRECTGKELLGETFEFGAKTDAVIAFNLRI